MATDGGVSGERVAWWDLQGRGEVGPGGAGVHEGRGRAERLGREGGSHGPRGRSGWLGGTTEPLLRFAT